MKRFLDSELFRKRWFRQLPDGFQQLWIYLVCECDPAGVIDYDEAIAEVYIGHSIPLQEVLNTFGEKRITRLIDGKLWLVGFCAFQYSGGVSPSAKVHSKVRASIAKHSLPIELGKPFEDLSNTYSKPIPEVSNTSLDMDMVQEEVKEEEMDGPTWTPDPIQQQINSWFRRRDTTAWSDKERRAYRKLRIDAESDEFGILARYYLAEESDDTRYRRKDIGTLLNNWTGETDRARRWAQKHPEAGDELQF